MGWVDIVFICLIVLFAIVGICKGLFESILSIFSSALSIVVAILLSKNVVGSTQMVQHYLEKHILHHKLVMHVQ